jgi:hypothetical protein
MNDLINSRDFVQGIVDKIVNETNLSETIMKIEPIIKENQELRALILSQQNMLNEMNTMVMRLLNQSRYYPEAGRDDYDIYEEVAVDVDASASASADGHSVSISLTNSNDSNEQSKIDENGLYQTDVVPEQEVRFDSYIVPNMDNVVMSIDDTLEPVAETVETIETVETVETADDDAVDDEFHEYENTPPHFPSDSRIALIINEI